MFDSDPEEEYQETINKLQANTTCIRTAEEKHHAETSSVNGFQDEAGQLNGERQRPYIDMAGGV